VVEDAVGDVVAGGGDLAEAGGVGAEQRPSLRLPANVNWLRVQGRQTGKCSKGQMRRRDKEWQIR